MTRRECLSTLGAVGLSSRLSSFSLKETPLLTRPIPSTDEKLPVIGVGTWQTFNVGSSEADRQPLKQVLKTLFENGGQVIDSSPMYGQSEAVVGDLSTDLNLNDRFFMATKVWTTGKENGISQMQHSLRLLKRQRMDLMQIHNLVDWQTHLKTLAQWKKEGLVRYIGITHYTDSMHATLANLIKQNKIDFVQVNYNLLDRNADRALFPVARANGVAVIVNRPFEEGALFQKIKGENLPEWAAEFDCKSWAQFFLKFILSHPDVTCTIPGTSKAHHLLDNLQAGQGKLPDPALRLRMIKWMDSL
jgi:diketogulonate reductase-like aldo/keto reductase